MAVVVPAPAALSGDLALFHTTDPLLSNAPVLVFHGSAATIGATSSRIQVHVFTPAGHASYARLAVSPNSPFYSAVSNLPREEQGDEVCRGLAFGLKKYFAELPENVKNAWCLEARAPAPSALFGDDHVAILASRMNMIENVDGVIGEIKQAFGEQNQSWVDVDVILPSGSIRETPKRSDSAGSEDFDEAHMLSQRYGRYAELIDSFGEPTFLPTSKLKRAPSKATSVGRTASFLKQQKENVRKEISELVETEASYVERITELENISENTGGEGGAEQAEVSPASLSDIVKLNGDFLTSLRGVLEATEQGALKDIDSMPEQQPDAHKARQDFTTDTQGIDAIAKCLCEWFPRFGDSYRAYLRSHAQAAQSMRALLKEQTESEFVEVLRDVGEQKLTSLLIEPVQRLPRYSLYIDTIIKQLPARHPATKRLLKARDIVTEICDSCNESDSQSTIAERLASRTSGWPSDVRDLGRLVTAADFVEHLPPYSLDGCEGSRGILLLFSDSVVFLGKRGHSATSAKTLVTELESGHAPFRAAQSRSGTPHDLSFLRRVPLDSMDCLEAQSGHTVQILTSIRPETSAESYHASEVDSSQMLKLEGFYERKGERLAEEIVKARVEGRFSEAERESPKWEVRASDPAADSASLFSAVFEDSNSSFVESRSSNALVRVVVDIDRHSQRPRAGQNGLRTVITLSPLRDGLWRLSVDSIDGSVAREHVPVSDILPTLRRKVSSLLGPRFSISQPSMASTLLSRNTDVLQSLQMHVSPKDDENIPQTPHRERHARPRSPRKMLSSFLSSTGSGSQQPPPHLKKDLPPLPRPDQLSRGHSFSQSVSKPPSRESRPPSRDQPFHKNTPSMRSTEQLANPIKRLEDTLSSYLLALQARKGNIVGRSLKMRASADELAVNELYNSLLEDPNVMALAAQATVDVLFAAFEKFLNIAWKDQVGQVLPADTIRDIQSKAESLFPSDFDEYFRTTVHGLSPQNQRAFKSILKLLAELLDGTGNDGDRGALTAAFAELLVTEGNPHDYIALIDRFVDDPDTYFGEPLDVQRAAEGALSAHKRARSANSASISSNTSSLRRKFGFGTLSRENSKSEQESKVHSVWRTLSKTTRGEQSPANSISRGTLLRSHSTDIDVRVQANRPDSQDGSLHDTSTLGDASFISSSSTHNLGLSTIGEHPSFIPTQPPRKKRRSSLSDLKDLEVSQAKSPPFSPPSTRRPPATNRFDDKSLPNSPQPSTPSSKGGSGRFGSPSKEPARSRLPSSFRKENSPGASKALGTSDARPNSSGGKSDEVVITARPSTSGIPTFTPRAGSPAKATSPSANRTGLAERPGAGNIVKRPSTSPEKAAHRPALSAPENGSPSKKLRMQSPQKLRERLQNEQSAVASAHTSLQDELSKIGDELTSTPSKIGSVRSGTQTTKSRSNTTGGTSMDLAQRVLKMEGQLPAQVEDLSTRINGIQSDLATSLTVSETKCKKLDELYREANGENEALYTRFNDELSRILRAVKGGEGVEELKKKLKESQEEAAKLKRENGRLKRENVGLRAQLRE